jgi:hypothetical protein
MRLASLMWVVALSAMWAAESRSGGVTVAVHEAQGVYQIHGAFQVAVPVAVAWDVLVDYEHIGAFVHSVRSSTFIPGPAGERVLQQQAIVSSFMFHRSIYVELALREVPGERVEFHDVSHRDFSRYAGAWELSKDSLGTAIDYSLEAAPGRGMPGILGRGVAARQARDLLAQVRAEMLRRAIRLPSDDVRPAARRQRLHARGEL